MRIVAMVTLLALLLQARASLLEKAKAAFESNKPKKGKPKRGKHGRRPVRLSPFMTDITGRINELNKLGMWEEALELFNSNKGNRNFQPDVVIYSTLINSLGKGRKTGKALKVFEEMQEKGLKPDVVTYSVLIHACVKGNQLDRAIKLFEVMKTQGIKPDTKTYHTLIHKCVQEHHPDRALRLFDMMKWQGVHPDEVLCKAAMRACEDNKEPERILEIFKDMKAQGTNIDSTTYGFIIRACENFRQLQPQTKTGDEGNIDGTVSKSQDNHHANVRYTTEINELGQKLQWQKAIDLFHSMKQDGVVPDARTWCEVIRACTRNKQLTKAMELFEAMKQEEGLSLTHAYNVLMIGFDRSVRPRDVVNLFDEMQTTGVEYNLQSYDVTIRAYEKLGEQKEAERLNLLKSDFLSRTVDGLVAAIAKGTLFTKTDRKLVRENKKRRKAEAKVAATSAVMVAEPDFENDPFEFAMEAAERLREKKRQQALEQDSSEAAPEDSAPASADQKRERKKKRKADATVQGAAGGGESEQEQAAGAESGTREQEQREGAKSRSRERKQKAQAESESREQEQKPGAESRSSIKLPKEEKDP